MCAELAEAIERAGASRVLELLRVTGWEPEKGVPEKIWWCATVLVQRAKDGTFGKS